MSKNAAAKLAIFSIIGAIGISCTPPVAAPSAGVKPDPNRVSLKDSDLPSQRLHLLHKGDLVEYVLPSGRRLIWKAERDAFGAEQATACGLKAHTQEPAFDELRDYSVSTSTREKISIYIFVIDGYQIERAEDLTASHGLPIIIRISPLTNIDHEAARAFFTAHVTAATSQPLRVPISTVHHELLQTLSFPVRLVVRNEQISFQVSGEVAYMPEKERKAKVSLLMDHVVKRYEGIDRISSFSVDVLKDNGTAFRYQARKNSQGQWALRKQ